MGTFQIEGRKKEEDQFIDSEKQLPESRPNPSRRLAGRWRFVDTFLRSPFILWMSLTAILAGISYLPTRRRSIYRPNDPGEPRPLTRKLPSRRTSEKRNRLTVFSMGIDLIVAVGMNLLKRHITSWSSAIKAATNDQATREIDPGLAERGTHPINFNELNKLAHEKSPPKPGTIQGRVWLLLKTTAHQWINDKCPQTGAALAYFTVFSLAPLVLILLAFFGLFFGSEHARDKIVEQLQYLIDPSGIKVIQDIAPSASKPQTGILATVIGIIVGLFGASGVFGQLQDALNTIWGVKAKPGASLWAFFRARFLSFAMVAGVCFLLLVSLTVESVLRGLSTYLQNVLPGGHILALALFLFLDVGVVILLFAMIFRFLPDIKIGWRDVWVGASLTAVLFVIGKFFLGLYLGSGAAGSAYGAASSLITLLLWIYYSAQILLFGAEFTQVYANTYGSQVEPEDHAVRVKRLEVEVPQAKASAA